MLRSRRSRRWATCVGWRNLTKNTAPFFTICVELSYIGGAIQENMRKPWHCITRTSHIFTTDVSSAPTCLKGVWELSLQKREIMLMAWYCLCHLISGRVCGCRLLYFFQCQSNCASGIIFCKLVCRRRRRRRRVPVCKFPEGEQSVYKPSWGTIGGWTDETGNQGSAFFLFDNA
jgi:hypothetical protein